MKLKHQEAQRLKGKVAIITGGGGTNSMGRSIGIRFAEEGAKVAVTDIDGPSAVLVTNEIAAGGCAAVAQGYGKIANMASASFHEGAPS